MSQKRLARPVKAGARTRSRLLAGAGVLAFMLFWTTCGAPGARAMDQDVQDLVLEVRMGRALVTPATVILEHKNRYYAPLIDIAENFDFVITDSDISRGYVQGWYISEGNRFTVDRQKLEAYHNNERIPLSEMDFIDDPYGEGTDIYVEIGVFSKIWPEIRFSVDLASLTMNAESDATFPFMEKKEREARQKMLETRRALKAVKQKDLPYIDNPYGLISKPVVDIGTTTRWDNDEKQLTSQMTVNGAQDLAYMTADYGLTLERNAEGYQAPENLRLTLSRESTPGEELPLGIEKVELGDTRVNYRELVGSSAGGRGIYFTTNKKNSNREFDIITIEGNGPPGWQTELYRNNELIDFGIVDQGGEYRFEDVSTQYGNNRIRVVLYGPQGQIREDVKDYNFSSAMLRPGETSVTGGLVDSDKDFIPLSKQDDSTRPRGIAKSIVGAFGLNRNVTLFSAINQAPVDDHLETYGSAGVTFSAAGGYGQVETYKQANGGHAVDLRFLTEVMGFRVNLAHVSYNNFDSLKNDDGVSGKRHEQDVTLARSFQLPFGSLGLQFDANRIARKNGDNDLTIRSRQSLGRAGIQLTHQTVTRMFNQDHETTSGNLSANVRMRKWRFTGNMAYDYFPFARFTTGSVEARYQTADDFTVAVSLQNDFVQDLIGAGVQVGYDFKRFLASIDTNWREQEGVSVILRASTSLGPYGSSGGYNMVSESQRGLSPVRGHAYLDKNLNSTFDEGDEPIEGAQMNVGGRLSDEDSDETGYMVARKNTRSGLNNIELASSSLADPYHAPAVPGYSIALRPGTIPEIQFPVIETGAIDGTILDLNGEAVQGINIQLVDDKGNVAAVTQSAFDGFYTFEFVRPGTYTVQVDPAHNVHVPPETVTVVSDDLFASGVDLLLEQAQETDGASADAQAEAADLESFDAEFKATEEEAATEGLSDVEPQSGAESGGVAQPYHEAHNGTRTPAPHSIDSGLSAVVHRVRIGEHPDRLRLVMELSGPVAYKIQAGETPNEWILDIPGTAWDALTTWRVGDSPVIQNFETEALPGDNGAVIGTRIRFRADHAFGVAGQGLLPPDGKAGHRLYIDFGKS